MKARPSNFKEWEIQAILDGRKTQTRRIIKPQPADDLRIGNYPDGSVKFFSSLKHEYGKETAHICPYGAVGDLLWLRENFATVNEIPDGTFMHSPPEKQIWYIADNDTYVKKTKPSTHMPRHASRITLEITDIRVERLQDISEEDAIAEGAPLSHPSIDVISRELGYEDFSRSWYAQLWEQINGKGSWEQNPWVWCVSFAPHLMNIDAFIKQVGQR